LQYNYVIFAMTIFGVDDVRLLVRVPEFYVEISASQCHSKHHRCCILKPTVMRPELGKNLHGEVLQCLVSLCAAAPAIDVKWLE